MNEHYEAVLADLKQMMVDAEAGILAIERLISRANAPGNANGTGKPGHPDAETSIPQRVIKFLETQPGKSFTIADIIEGIGEANVQTLRGALGRMVKSDPPKIGKYGRGRYRAARPKTQPDA